MVKDACDLFETDTTSEPFGGNAMPGAPVIASMSDSQGCNQGGTVEYFCIPPLILSGVGLFLCLPQYKGGTTYGKRKSVHL